MFKIITKNKKIFQKLSQIPFFKDFIVWDLENLDELNQADLFVKAITQVRTANGIYKTTRPNRFIDLDDASIKLLDKNKIYFIHDVAASDGITSLDLFNKLKSKNIHAKILFSDKFVKIYCEKRWFGSLYKDQEGIILFGNIFKFQALKQISRRYFFSKLLGYFIPVRSNNTKSDKEILLLNPKTKAAIEEKNLEFRYCDILESNLSEKTYDIIRCMNILNVNVFPIESISTAIKNLNKTLHEGGYLIIGRTDENSFKNHASIFVKENNKLKLVLNINEGFDLMNLINQL